VPGPLSARGRITSRANPLVREARDLLSSRGRREQSAFVAEGVKLVRDALRAGARPLRAFVVPELLKQRDGGAALLAELDPAKTIETSPELLAWLADTETTQGIVSVFPVPEERAPADAGQVVLVLDGLQDPGNVGTVLRSAVGAGLVRTVVVRGGADPFGPKAVRAAAGALFHLAVVRTDESLVGRPIWLADMDGDRSYDRVDWRAPSALVLGSEAGGPSPEMRARATGAVSVPLRGPVESLNAGIAASIILFEAARQLASTTAE
jgi:RNA methyltransferase, TrmH family